MTVGRSRRLEATQFLPLPLREVFAFFSDAANLERITPSFLRFRILTPLPVAMAPGARIDYRLRLAGIPFRWRTRIDVFEPMRRFVDSQERGPYARWVHLHEFHEVPGGTLVVDTVDYALPLGPLGSLAHGLFVGRALRRIFDHRRAAVAALLRGPAPSPPPPRPGRRRSRAPSVG